MATIARPGAEVDPAATRVGEFPLDVSAVAVALAPVQTEFAAARGDASLPYTLTMIGFGIGAVEIVGVVGDMAVTDLTGAPPLVGYYAWDQASRATASAILTVRGDGDPATLVPAYPSIKGEPVVAQRKVVEIEQIVGVEPPAHAVLADAIAVAAGLVPEGARLKAA